MRVTPEILMHTPLNDQQIVSQGFDFELKFLDSYVQQQRSLGKKGYDDKRKQAYGDFSGLETGPHVAKELNYKPYQTPGMTRVNTTLPQSNPLF